LTNVTIRVDGQEHEVLRADLHGVCVGAAAFGTVEGGSTTGYEYTREYGTVGVAMDSMTVRYTSCFAAECDTLEATVRRFRSMSARIDRYLRNTIVIDRGFVEEALVLSKTRLARP